MKHACTGVQTVNCKYIRHHQIQLLGQDFARFIYFGKFMQDPGKSFKMSLESLQVLDSWAPPF
jgi:hypothetical protein